MRTPTLTGAVFRSDVQRALLRQGVTTVIAGQDGVSYAPGDGVWSSRYFAAINGPHPTFAGGAVAELLATYDGTTPLGDGYLVPAGTARHAVMGMDASPPTVTQLPEMTALVAAGLADGALGLSTGLDYVPGIFADAREIAALCTPVAAADGVYVTHMRGGYETAAAAGLEEVFQIARASRVRTHVSHYHVDAAEGIRLIDDLAALGVDVSFDTPAAARSSRWRCSRRSTAPAVWTTRSRCSPTQPSGRSFAPTGSPSSPTSRASGRRGRRWPSSRTPRRRRRPPGSPSSRRRHGAAPTSSMPPSTCSWRTGSKSAR
ncbi:hypothetical protein [Microbacterium lacticum]|uniref:hypothetical protein n=1 Tax=Microbacterium lacticum TaxID=33885 RepID=UPI00116AE558|nr:hypothetical protein [Microbacterium lacticum]GEB94039.1 hypothetical protein MLA01_02580 [Microbacterium lacticum]GGN19592.1 hypothetical protein GCM10009724_11980 [Microbacterium lacticum]